MNSALNTNLKVKVVIGDVEFYAADFERVKAMLDYHEIEFTEFLQDAVMMKINQLEKVKTESDEATVASYFEAVRTEGITEQSAAMKFLIATQYNDFASEEAHQASVDKNYDLISRAASSAAFENKYDEIIDKLKLNRRE